jgi:hypothetical protein
MGGRCISKVASLACGASWEDIMVGSTACAAPEWPASRRTAICVARSTSRCAVRDARRKAPNTGSTRAAPNGSTRAAPDAGSTRAAAKTPDALVATLQREFGSSLVPPAEAAAWSEAHLRCWFKDGGNLTIESATDLFELTGRAHLRYVGLGLPLRAVARPTLEIYGGLLGASERCERQTFDALALQIAHRGFALVDLGGPPELYAAACEEGRKLWPRMRAGELTNKDGVLSSGQDPSGSLRGDRFVDCSEVTCRSDRLDLTCLDWTARR